MPILPSELPTTEDALRSFITETLGLGPQHEPLPFFDANGAWAFDPAGGWESEWVITPRFLDWREGCDTRYEGLEREDKAAEQLAAGYLPAHIADDDTIREELWKDHGGNVFLCLAGARTPQGTEPIFFFDHDVRHRIQVRARNLIELFARQAVAYARHTLELAIEDPVGVLDAPIPLDHDSLHRAGMPLAEGWRAALGMPARTEPLPPRPKPARTPRVEGAALGELQQVHDFKERFIERYCLAASCDDAAFTDLLRPLQWWDAGSFEDFEGAIRNVMARIAAIMGMAVQGGVSKHQFNQLMEACQFIEGYSQRNEISAKPHQDPLDVVGRACQLASKLRGGAGRASVFDDLPEDDGRTILDEVPQMRAFHDGWRGILPDRLLDQGDERSLLETARMCSELTLCKNTTYGLVRSCGDDHLQAIEASVFGLVPADQLFLLHGLDNFPLHEGVIALYERVLAESPYDHVKRSTTRYLERVRGGIKPTGWES